MSLMDFDKKTRQKVKLLGVIIPHLTALKSTKSNFFGRFTTHQEYR